MSAAAQPGAARPPAQRIPDRGDGSGRAPSRAQYEVLRRAGRLVHRFSFASLGEYLSYLEHAPTSPAFQDMEGSKQGSAAFTGTESFEEAVRLARFGSQEGFDELVGLTEKIKRSLDMVFGYRRTFNDYVGFAPDVKAYLEGSPLSMVNRYVRPKRRVTIYFNTSYDGNADPRRILHRGACLLSAVEVLELLDLSVDLRVFEMSYCTEFDAHVSEFALKNPDERLNMQKLCFPLCHPSWVRRLNFRLIETTPGIAPEWAATYGTPADAGIVKAVLGLGEGDILIPTIDELGIGGTDILADAQLLFARINPTLPEEFRLKFL